MVVVFENVKYVFVFFFGSVIIVVIFQLFVFGLYVIFVFDVYGGIYCYFIQVVKVYGVKVIFIFEIEVDICEYIIFVIKLVWIEIFSNFIFCFVDICVVVIVVYEYGIMVVVDNIFLSFYIQNFFDYGVDIVVYSVIKYINGYSDVVMGVVVFNSEEFFKRFLFLQNVIGVIFLVFDVWFVYCGVKILYLCVCEVMINVMVVGYVLEVSFYVIVVNYFGFDFYLYCVIVKKQYCNGMGGGMLLFCICGGYVVVECFCQLIRIFIFVEFLGGVESLCEVLSSMIYVGIFKEQCEVVGVFDDFVCFSCGVEDVEDFKNDVFQVFECVVVEIFNGNGINGVNGY